MKKKITAITAAALLTAAPISAYADALDPTTYIPTIYFKALPESPVLTLPSGMPYVNTKAAADDTYTIPAHVYLKDECKRVGQFTFKWLWTDDNVYLNNIQTPIEAGTSAPYTGYDTNGVKNDTAVSISKFYSEKDKMIGIDYSNISVKPLETTGEASDSFPVALFDVNVKNTASPDYYDFSFKTEQPYVSNIAYRVTDIALRDIRPNGDNALPLTIAVTDRALGDVNDDGIVDGKDATAVLTDYALSSANKEGKLTKAQLIAADVNGNVIVDGNDATKILSYYAFTSASNEGSFIDYLNGKLKK